MILWGDCGQLSLFKVARYCFKCGLIRGGVEQLLLLPTLARLILVHLIKYSGIVFLKKENNLQATEKPCVNVFFK